MKNAQNIKSSFEWKVHNVLKIHLNEEYTKY